MIINCDYCEEEFKINPAQYKWAEKQGWKHYCSQKCLVASRTKKECFKCANCGRDVFKTPAEFSKSKSGRVFCSKSCSNSYTNKTSRNGEDNPNYVNGIGSYRIRALEEYGEACTICGYDIIKNLEVHHRDNDRNNNKIENLDVLCPTHHKEYEKGIREYNEGD